MHLHRVTPDPFEAYGNKDFLGTISDDFSAKTPGRFDEEPAVVVVTKFPRFGGGERRQSDFEVHSYWKDVEAIIEKFCEAKHPEAIALREARALATAIKGLGWNPPHSN